ncbi:MAG: pyrroline-5-carboxylate reductase [Desulfovibrio sp.]|jgi:pyrroline-5-carboxylate reductase|nr:pyrroline-5-carboxylate reductase [Desulfovibrio sp.]
MWAHSLKEKAMTRIGCIGCGNMGGAILAGLADRFDGTHAFCGCDRAPERMRPLEEKGVVAMANALDVAKDASLIVLAVKPYQAAGALEEIRPALAPDKVLVSVVAGMSRKTLCEASGGKCPVVRCMPNTPALVGEGVFALCFDDASLSSGIKSELLAVFGSLGLCLTLPESQFIAFSALIGAGPAYVFEMMQGLVQAGVTLGFTHQQSRQMIAALFAGSARMAKQIAAPLMQLRDDVCSPGGLTIAGVNHLDRAGLIGVLVDAVLASEARGREMEQ